MIYYTVVTKLRSKKLWATAVNPFSAVSHLMLTQVTAFYSTLLPLTSVSQTSEPRFRTPCFSPKQREPGV